MNRQSRETSNNRYTRRRKTTQHNMWWTPLCTKTHK